MTGSFVRATWALHRNAGPDVVAMVVDEPEVHVLSGPAALIWRLLAEEGRIEDVTDEVARVYQRPAEEVRASVEDCVRTLVDRRLAEERP